LTPPSAYSELLLVISWEVSVVVSMLVAGACAVVLRRHPLRMANDGEVLDEQNPQRCAVSLLLLGRCGSWVRQHAGQGCDVEIS
jgi:hypothetical protein